MSQISILFVCMGNICRSPTAEGVFRALVEKDRVGNSLIIDSAGTHAYHSNEAPDPRAQSKALERGIDISNLKARPVYIADFEDFEHILVMDERNYQDVIAICPRMFAYKVRYFMEYAPHLNTRNLPDPYYGGINGFERVLDMVEDAAKGLLQQLQAGSL